jgi:hypothetical protein
MATRSRRRSNISPGLRRKDSISAKPNAPRSRRLGSWRDTSCRRVRIARGPAGARCSGSNGLAVAVSSGCRRTAGKLEVIRYQWPGASFPVFHALGTGNWETEIVLIYSVSSSSRSLAGKSYRVEFFGPALLFQSPSFRHNSISRRPRPNVCPCRTISD